MVLHLRQRGHLRVNCPKKLPEEKVPKGGCCICGSDKHTLHKCPERKPDPEQEVKDHERAKKRERNSSRDRGGESARGVRAATVATAGTTTAIDIASAVTATAYVMIRATATTTTAIDIASAIGRPRARVPAIVQATTAAGMTLATGTGQVRQRRRRRREVCRDFLRGACRFDDCKFEHVRDGGGRYGGGSGGGRYGGGGGGGKAGLPRLPAGGCVNGPTADSLTRRRRPAGTTTRTATKDRGRPPRRVRSPAP